MVNARSGPEGLPLVAGAYAGNCSCTVAAADAASVLVSMLGAACLDL